MAAEQQGTRAARGIVEIIVGGGMNSLVELNDGRVMMLSGEGETQATRDLGKTWEKPQPIVCDGAKLERGLIGVTRLASGKLAVICYKLLKSGWKIKA